MMNEKGPLMFINTASTKVEKSGEQVVYDSRSPKVKKVVEEIATKEFVDEKKLNNIIEMYNKKRPVFCNIEVGEEIIEGSPYMKDGEKYRELHYIKDDTLAWQPNNYDGILNLI